MLEEKEFKDLARAAELTGWERNEIASAVVRDGKLVVYYQDRRKQVFLPEQYERAQPKARGKRKKSAPESA